MSLILSGTDGLSDVDGTAATPAIRGTDANTGIFFPAADTIAFAEGGAEAMRIDSSGNVGIGTSSPNASFKLDVAGKIRVAPSSGNAELSIRSPSGSSSYITFTEASVADRAAIGFANGSGNLQFRMGGYDMSTGTQSMTLDSSGNLLVGTTSNNSTSRTVIRGTQNVLNLDNAGGQYTTLTYSNNDVAKAYVYYDNTNTRTYVQTGASGGVYLASGGTSWTAVSDERTKDIIESIENANQKIANWRTVIGKYKSDEDGVRRSFLIAQDVLTTFPEAVDMANPDEYGLKYQDVIPVLVAAIKEQSALITQLTARITALESA